MTDAMTNSNALTRRLRSSKDLSKDPLSGAELQFYQDHGYLLVKKFIDQDTIAQMNYEVSTLHARLAECNGVDFTEAYGVIWEDVPPDVPQRIRQLMGSQNLVGSIRAIAESDKLIAAIEQLVGEPVELFHSKLMMKAAGLGSAIPWHSDWGYWKDIFKQPTQMNAFLAIDPATIENGCIRYVPGSHRAYREHSIFKDANGFQIGLPGDIDAFVADPICMEPGDIAFHGSFTIHGSEANHSVQDRAMNTFAFTPKNSVLNNLDAQRQFAWQRMQRENLFDLS